MKYVATLFCFLFASNLFAQTTISGAITDGNGKAPKLAQIHFGSYGDDQKKNTTITCATDGHYHIIAKPGIYSLRVSAVDHQEVTIPLILDENDKDVTINIQLNPNPFNNEFEKIAVIGDWNKFAFATTESMTPKKLADGKTIYTYERTATGDTLSYQLLGIAGGHSVNGTQSDYLTYDGGGDYRSVLKTKKGQKVTITFDPSKLVYKESPSLPVITALNNPFISKAIALTNTVEKLREATFAKPAGGGPASKSAPKHQALLDYIKGEFEKDKASGDTKSAQFDAVTLALEYDLELPFGADNAMMILNAVPASSPLWTLAVYQVMDMAALAEKNFGAAYKKDLQKNPAKTVRAIAIADEMQHAVEAKDMQEWKRIFAILKTEYGDVAEIKWTMTENNPDADVAVGKNIPSFEVALLDGSGKVSDKSMLGKYYMIDFWATWCGPCVREMPAIHKAYERFKGRKGFEIVSLSMDASQDAIAPFRTKKWKMPWIHAFIPGVFEAELAKKFEVAGIPKPVLVGPDGKVVAMQEALRGDNLEKTLGKFLGESN